MLDTSLPEQFELLSTKPAAKDAADEAPGSRYERTIHQLFDDAERRGALGDLANVLTWALASVVVKYANVDVCGDILMRLGTYVRRITEYHRASREAEEARREGRKPQ